MRILVADDNALVRRGVRDILSGEDDCTVCGEAKDAPEALRKALELRPDLVLLDLSMPGQNGLEAARSLRQALPSTRVLMLSHHDPEQLLTHALNAGAIGCLDKARVATDLVSSIRRSMSIGP